ncbi:hypothetical protein AARAC_000160 [Aspergillus arachidicola]|uniref:Uncharacterized protein n=1 Tax=Aspergillus arachidicola TaxID=656916 RepID=A0A2G7FRC0_9EURO|nr:hypothetical protein AARAC_000160 [Aspergillus arachidicola]
MAYELTKDDLDCEAEWNPAPVRAAGNPNPAVLEALMNYYRKGLSRWNEMSADERKLWEQYSPNNVICGAIWGDYESPLTAALKVKSTQNVNILLDAGADINGISAEDLSDYSARFLRGRDASIDISSFGFVPFRAELLATAKARSRERRPGFPRFWTEPNVPGQRLRMATALTSLEVAAKFGCEEIFEILYKAGAEDSSCEAPLSALLVSSPMHQAIASGHRLMFDKILNTYNYYPDYRPLVTPTVALPPLFFAIARCDLAKPGVRECISDLFAHPRLSPHLRTPILEVHPLHFATARHDPEFLSWTADLIPGGHATAGRIALGHTLLHVAALPLTGNQSLKPSPLHLEYPKHSRPPYINEEKPYKHVPMTEAEQVAQLATIALLLTWGVLDFQAQDIDGNTALHYLAATLNVGDETVELVREMEGGEDVWENATNRWGFTPKQLEEEEMVDNCKDA